MTQILNLPFQSAADFSNCRWLAANGIFQAGSTLPNGITDHIFIENNACKLLLNTVTDAPDSSGWMRTEVDFGDFPTAFGEVWSTFEFKYDWTFTNYIVIGSWSVMISGASGTTYVPIGFRIRDNCLVIQAPLDLGVIGFSNQDLAVIPIQPGTWYQVCAHSNLQSGATGFREILLDGVPIFRQWNAPTTYVDATAHYFKVGPYDGLHTKMFTEAIMHIRNVTMWTGNDGYQAVIGGVPRTPRRLVQG